MSFYERYLEYKNFDFENFFDQVTDRDIINIINKDRRLSELEFLMLLSKKAVKYLEPLAQKANRITVQNFGKVIFLYTPMYLANYCVNQCIYCGFNITNNIKRRKLTLDEVEKEAYAISSTGLRHILILTGESRKESPVQYIKDCVKILQKYFRSISIEVYPLEENEYAELIEAGVDGLTIYQEVYDEEKYKALHLKGPKRNYLYRLDAPERACKASMRNVNIGALLDFMTGGRRLFTRDFTLITCKTSIRMWKLVCPFQDKAPSLWKFVPDCKVEDRDLVQIMIAYRLFMPRAGDSNFYKRKREP